MTMLRAWARAPLAILRLCVAGLYKFALLLKLYVGVLEREAMRATAGSGAEDAAQASVDDGLCQLPLNDCAMSLPCTSAEIAMSSTRW